MQTMVVASAGVVRVQAVQPHRGKARASSTLVTTSTGFISPPHCWQRSASMS